MAVYKIALGFNGADTLRLLKFACGPYLISKGIRPHLTIGAFVTENEELFSSYFSVLSRYLEGTEINIAAIEMRGTAKIILEARINDELSDNFYKTYVTLARHFDVGLGGAFTPSNWVPRVTVGAGLLPNDCLEYYAYCAKAFKPFEVRACKALLIRCDPYTEIGSAELISKAADSREEDDITARMRRATRLAKGMELSDAEKVLGQRLKREHCNYLTGYGYDYVKLSELGVQLFFRPNGGRLYNVRFEAPFCVPICGIKLGMTRMEINSILGPASSYGDTNYFYDKTWYYDHTLPDARLRIDFEDNTTGGCRKIYFC